MNDRLDKLRDATQRREFKRFRTGPSADAGRWLGFVSEQRRVTELFKIRCREEIPIVLPDERIAFMRSRNSVAGNMYDCVAWMRFPHRAFSAVRTLASRWLPGVKHVWRPVFDCTISNAAPDHALFLRQGLNGRISAAENRLAEVRDGMEREFLVCSIEGLEALKALVARYADEADRVGNAEVADILRRVPAEPPRTFHEALQALRILQFSLYLHGMSHCGLGRMDQYLLPYYHADVDSGRLTRNQAGELLSEFFISLNRDADLYPGVQQGDNGQSVMLGGCRPEDGSSAVNELTYLILEVSRDLRLIDPKINLRIDRNTPLDLLELGSELTKCGLGFPQYSNDEVVIPALVGKGYELQDARDYVVAACWEFVIPGKSLEIVNKDALSFPHAVDSALREEVATGRFEERSFRGRIRANIQKQVGQIVQSRIIWHPAPFLSVFFDRTLETGRDITKITRYRNVGIHGAGSANAADALVAALQVYSQDGMPGLRRLVQAEDEDFVGHEELLDRLRTKMPKVGNADDAPDRELKWLFDEFADVADKFSSDRCMIRPGSGSAMYYLWLTNANNRIAWLRRDPVVGATSDGRRRNAPLASSLAPSHEAKVGGILSVLKSFSVIDYSRIMNGGPITVEFDHSVFKTQEGVKKLAQLIRYFVSLGGQQLQLNVLNVEELEDALVRPDLHRNLVVRVWGWSGYFCELDRGFQMQIIRRHRYGI